MTASEARWSAATLELVPLDAPLAKAPAPSARSSPAVPEGDHIRDAYLRARFPGAIRSAADLADADRVMDAARCYVEGGQDDRARELVRLAIGAHPEAGAFRQAPRQEPAIPGDAAPTPARLHARTIHRYVLSATRRGTTRH